MKNLILTIVILFAFGTCLEAQVTLNGRITDKEGLSLPGANISMKDTYDGTSADTAGYFKFTTSQTGKQVLVVSYIGYKTIEQELDLSDVPATIPVTMEEQAGEIKSVMITAGAFETGDLKRPIVLKPMDIATTPSAVGDVYGALATLPGNQVVGDEGGLFVRGGEGYETKTFIDGLQVANPYMSKMPDLPTRSRFSPILFNGVAFSTGGYSAEYGQALSSAVNLNTTGLADNSQGAVSLMSVGVSGSYTHRWQNASLSGTLQYINMKPYYSLVKQEMEWKKPPEQLGGTLLYRQKFRKYGLLKVFGSADNNRSTLYYKYIGDTADATPIENKNHDYYINAVYNDLLSEKWRFKTGLAYGFNNNEMGFNQNRLTEKVNAVQHRLTITHDVNDQVHIKMGEEVSAYFFNRNYYTADSAQTYEQNFRITNYALYIEPEIRINNHFVARAGIRSEYLSLMREWQLMPRISLAYHLGDYSQFSMAYGLFRQRPDNAYLVNNQSLTSERATHLIVNYQYEVDNRIFRLELYKKWYNNLVTFETENSPDPANYSNNGDGHAQGIDLFWRDSKTIRDLDYWISYSFIDTKRFYKEYEQSRVPSFISPHTFSIVTKYYFRNANTYAGVTYMHASPKTCYNPALPVSAGDETKAYNDLSLNITFIRPLLGTYGAFLININNILGFDNVYGYNYSTNPDEGDNYARYPIKPQSKRFFVIGAYLLIQ